MIALLDWSIKASVLLLLTWSVVLCIKSASLRRAAWLAGFCASAMIPLVALLLPGEVRTADVRGVTLIVDTPAIWPVYVWISGLACVVLYAVFAYLALWRLGRHSVKIASEDATDLAALAGVARWSLRMSVSDSPPSAITWGWIRPVVLLPRNSASWSEGRRRAVLLHELAHIRRRDSFFQALVLVYSAVFWFNPLVWLCARAFRQDVEAAADEAVLNMGIRATDYASVLLSLAGELGRGRHPELALSVARRGRMERRIRSIVGRAVPLPATSHVAAVCAVALVAAAALGSGRAIEDTGDLFKGRSAEWIAGYRFAQSFVKERGSAHGAFERGRQAPSPTHLTDQERRAIEAALSGGSQ